MRKVLFILMCVPQGVFAASFHGLGDLPGGAFESFATGMSADGSVIVGYSTTFAGTTETRRAFRWTEFGGMETHSGFLLGSDSTEATSISANGSVVVGIRRDGANRSGFRWTAEEGLRGISNTSGNGLFMSEAWDVSGNGGVVVGVGRVDGDERALRWEDRFTLEEIERVRFEKGSVEGFESISVWPTVAPWAAGQARCGMSVRPVSSG